LFEIIDEHFSTFSDPSNEISPLLRRTEERIWMELMEHCHDSIFLLGTKILGPHVGTSLKLDEETAPNRLRNWELRDGIVHDVGD
jgi:hypothetical protein